jgi:hypothetical protein
MMYLLLCCAAGLFLALPGDWCVDANNTQDAMVLCSTAAPLCDAGFSGKCIDLADDAKQPLLLTPSECTTCIGRLCSVS